MAGPVILSIATEWWSHHGGLSTLNRRLCIDLADHCAVYCLVPGYLPEEQADARAHRVRLVVPKAFTPFDDWRLLCEPDEALPQPPEYIIGHGHVTGAEALFQVQSRYTESRFVYVVHTVPGELAPYRWASSSAEPARATLADDRERSEGALIEQSWATLAVGPRLRRHAEELARAAVERDVPVPVLEYIPTLDVPVVGSPATAPTILLQGRLDDAEVKGVPLVVAALAKLSQEFSRHQGLRLLLRGLDKASESQWQTSWAAHIARTDNRVEVDYRPFSTDPRTLNRDFARASVVVLPSRVEGFGLIGLEAIARGVPVLLTERSGLAEWLRNATEELDPGIQEIVESMVVEAAGSPEEQALRWARQLNRVLADPSRAFDKVARLRDAMQRKGRWPHRSNAYELLTEINLHWGIQPSGVGEQVGDTARPGTHVGRRPAHGGWFSGPVATLSTHAAGRQRPSAAPRATQNASGPPLSAADIGRATGGALIVYLAAGNDMPDGRLKVNEHRLDDRTVLANMEGVWKIGRFRSLWIADPDRSPRALVGVFGPPHARRIVGSTPIDVDEWERANLDAGYGLFWVPVADRCSLDFCNLQGRPLQGVKFGAFSWQLYIWVDGDGHQQHPPLIADEQHAELP